MSRVKIIALMSLTSILSFCPPVRSTSNRVLESPSIMRFLNEENFIPLQKEISTQSKIIEVVQSTNKVFSKPQNSAQDFSTPLQPVIYSVLPLILGIVTMAIVTAFRNITKTYPTVEETSKDEVFDLYRKEVEELLIDKIISTDKVELAQSLNKKPEELDVQLKELLAHLISKKKA